MTAARRLKPDTQPATELRALLEEIDRRVLNDLRRVYPVGDVPLEEYLATKAKYLRGYGLEPKVGHVTTPDGRKRRARHYTSHEELAETENQDYDPGIVGDTARDLNALADDLGYTSFEQAKRVLERGAPKMARETPARAKTKPRAKWKNRKGADAKLTPPEFVAKHYAAEMAAGTLHRGLIGQEDKDLAVKLASWQRSHPMPEGVDIPTLPEWNTRQLTKLSEPPRPTRIVSEQERLYQAARYRAAKVA